MGNITIQGDLTGDVPGGEVGGASNLTTVGAIPYVSATGTLNQDPTALFWDAANNYLYAGGYTSPSNYSVRIGPGNSEIFIRSGNGIISHSGANMAIGSTTSMSLNANNVEVARFAATTGNFLIGTTTDSNFKLDVAASGSAGTMRVYDATPTTGSTKVVFRAGAGQSGSLQEWQNSAGTVLTKINSTGAVITPQLESSASFTNVGDNTYGYIVGSSGGLVWSSTSVVGGTKDLSLSRASAGVLQVGDGGANANGYLSAARIGVGTASPTTVLDVVGSAPTFTLRDSGALYGTKLNITGNTTGQYSIKTLGSSEYLLIGGGSDARTLITSGDVIAMSILAATRNVKIGDTAYSPAETNFKLDVVASGSAGTMRVYDATATTGVTKAVIRAGAGQSTTNLTEWQNSAGAALAYISSGGNVVSNASVYAGASGYILWQTRTSINSPSDGVLALYNSTQSDFSRLQFGGTTSSFPALKRLSNALNVRLADDSGDAGMSAAYILASNGTGIYFQIVNATAPSLKRSGTTLQVRLGDDSANTQIQASRFISDQTTPTASTDAGTAGAIWADANYIYVQTAAGTIKRVALTTF